MPKLAASNWAKIGLSFGSLLIISYLSLLFSLRLGQTRLMFFPPPDTQATPADEGLSYENVWLLAPGQVHGWWIPAATAQAPVLLYLHGNGSNIGDLIGRASRFHRLGLAVLLIDYRGYGNSNGPFPNETRVYEDAEAAWFYLTQTRQLAPTQIIVYGQSLGGAIAIELAIRHPVAGVIVESTFTSMKAMVDWAIPYQLFPINWILTQHFDSLSKIRSLHTPILLIHGTADQTVPVQMSRALFQAAPQPKQLLLIPEAGHDNVASLDETRYLQVVREFVNLVFSY